MILVTPASALIGSLSIKIEAHATEAQVFLLKAREADGRHGEAELNAAAALLEIDLDDLAAHSGPLPVVTGNRYAMVTLTRSQVETGNAVANQLLAGARAMAEAAAKAALIVQLRAWTEAATYADLEALVAGLPVQVAPAVEAAGEAAAE